jgi:hypothetical protein
MPFIHVTIHAYISFTSPNTYNSHSQPQITAYGLFRAVISLKA